MKTILLSKQPQIVMNVLNENSKLLVCKKFPVDYVGWVYIYCTKGELLQAHWGICNNGKDKHILYGRKCKDKDLESPHTENGKVIARFWCDNVERFYNAGQWVGEEPNDIMNIICNNACISRDDLDDYCEGNYFYTINISKLEVFDKPLYLDDFTRPAKCRHCEKCEHKNNKICDKGFVKMFDKAPKNYCYVEEVE